ncbi:MAG: hypothetical protein V3W34_09850 [Phycisphaerae bacterium]
MLGLFFFALFGLLIGAVMYRIGLPAQPVPSVPLRIGVGIVVLLCWGLSIAIEAHDFPTDQADALLRIIEPLPDGMTGTMVKADIAEFARDTLRQNHGGDGVLGYSRWVVASSRMEYHVETMKNPVVLKPPQHRWWWATRVLLSVVLLTFGIYTQAAPLARRVEAAVGPAFQPVK